MTRRAPVLARALLLGAALILSCLEARAAPPAAPGGGFSISIEQGTQMDFGGLSIGLIDASRGYYLDGGGRRRYGLRASLALTLLGQPKSYRQVDAVKGQVILIGGYRVLVQDILPKGDGSVVVAVRGPAPKPKSWLSRLLERL
ncbi:MAG: hypothetical protein KGM24_05555 [Elusimicrobia bacterium]|nr:hypothetical protein [Elusimicrobiota bacterium]